MALRPATQANLVGKHVGKVQAQLSVAVERGFGAGNIAQNCMIDIAAVLMRINSNRTSANDDVPGLEGLGEGGQRQGQREAVNRVLRIMLAPCVRNSMGQW